MANRKYAKVSFESAAIGSVNYVDVPGAVLSLSDVKVDDLISVHISGLWAASTGEGCLDVVSVVAGAITNSWNKSDVELGVAPDNGNNGVFAWFGPGSSQNVQVGGSVSKLLLPSDIDGKALNIKFRVKVNIAAKTLSGSASGNNRLYAWAINHGQ